MLQRIVIVASFVTLIGCGHSGTKHPIAAWNTQLESELTHSYSQKTLVLGHTFNVGPRIDELGASLADPRPFDAFVVTDADGIQHALAAGGKTIPVGTQVEIEGFVPPTTSIWPGTHSAETDPSDGQIRVLFRVRDGDTKGRFAVVLPVAANDSISLRGAMNQKFQTKNWLDTWFATRSEEVKTAILEKKVLPGMSNAEVRVAVGVASNESERSKAGPQFTAQYGDLRVVFAGATVQETKSLRAEAERQRAEDAKKKLEEEKRIAELEAADKAEAERVRAEAEAAAVAKAEAEAAAQKKKKKAEAEEAAGIPVIKALDSKESKE